MEKHYYTDPERLGLNWVETICIGDNGNCGIFDITFSGEKYSLEELRDEFERLEYEILKVYLDCDDDERNSVYKKFDFFHYGCCPEGDANFLVRALLKMPEQKGILEILSELGWESMISRDGKVSMASRLFGDGEPSNPPAPDSRDVVMTSMRCCCETPAGLSGITYFSGFDSDDFTTVPDNQVILFSVTNFSQAETLLKDERVSVVSCFKNRNSGNTVYSLMLDTTKEKENE